MCAWTTTTTKRNKYIYSRIQCVLHAICCALFTAADAAAPLPAPLAIGAFPHFTGTNFFPISTSKVVIHCNEKIEREKKEKAMKNMS